MHINIYKVYIFTKSFLPYYISFIKSTSEISTDSITKTVLILFRLLYKDKDSLQLSMGWGFFLFFLLFSLFQHIINGSHKQ